MAGPAYQLPGPLGILDSVIGATAVIEYILLGLLLLNIVTRIVAHRRHLAEADEGVESLSRHPLHVASNVLLLLGSFYYTTLHQHAGIVATSLVVGIFITDFFEFEARNVELRREVPLDRPKGAIAASLLAFLYIGYLSAFQYVAPIWNAVV